MTPVLPAPKESGDSLNTAVPFGEQLPFILAHAGPELRAACLPVADMTNYRAKGEADGVSPELVAQIAQAQRGTRGRR